MGSTSSRCSASRIRWANGGGSSSVLSKRLAAWSFMLPAASITNTRRLDSNGVCAAAATTGSSMSLTSTSLAPLGVTQVRSGWASRRTRASTVCGLLRAVGKQGRRERARDRALAGARRAVEEVGVRRAAGRGQRRQQHGACVRMRLDPGEHPLDGNRLGGRGRH